jgi:hypothetical protein
MREMFKKEVFSDERKNDLGILSLSVHQNLDTITIKFIIVIETNQTEVFFEHDEE